ncbi:flavin reductase family protein [Oscillospiraceae bacterium OttesenSCG-928-G22]|nr:flavin reductase family protein [Oscillospiraceae bacterium OttesenSCG-928-G22]
MYEYQAAEITGKDTYKYLSGSLIPRPIALVTTLEPESDTVNAGPFSFFSVVNYNPPTVTVSVSRMDDGSIKDTARNALATGELVIHLVHREIVEDMVMTSKELPRNESELPHTNFTTVPSEHVKVPGLKEALIRFECKLIDRIEMKNDEGETETDLLFARVLKYYFDESMFDPEKKYILPEKFSPVGRLSGEQYATIDEIFKVKFPD